MPLVSHNQLPSFKRLEEEGIKVLDRGFAQHQDIRELHIGLLNIMPDSALAATERQFFRLIGESNPIAQFYIHPFTLDELPRGSKAKQHIDKYYESFEQIKQQGLDGLIVTGANVSGNELSQQPFWQPLIEVFEWAHENVVSTLCSCLATHAVLEFRYKQKRQLQTEKVWGVYPHQLLDKSHPLIRNINTRFDVPHSRWNAVNEQQFIQSGLRILAKSNTNNQNHIHLATSKDGIRTVFFQGHPEYDAISLLKEYKREVLHYLKTNSLVTDRRKIDTAKKKVLKNNYPPFPDNYFNSFQKSILNEYQFRSINALAERQDIPEFPEQLLISSLDNTWHDTADEVISNWMGIIYQLTHKDRDKLFMDGIDPEDPLDLNK
ncbi:MAG: homoserine O-succinyltransferase [Pseudomonadota bacterium]